MIQILRLSPEPDKTEIEPSPAVDGIAGSDAEAVKVTRAGFPSRATRIQSMGSAQNTREIEIVLPLRASDTVVEGVENTVEGGRVISPGKVLVSKSFGLMPAEQYSMSETLGIVEDLPTPESRLSSLALGSTAKGIGEGIERANAQNAPSQPLSKAEGIAERTVLEGIPVEEIDVEPLSRIVFHTDPRGLAADRFRFLRMRIRELSDAKKLKSLLITSALSLDGKSTVSLNLATALADRGRNAVLLLEADLYHPTLAQRLGLTTGPGLAECLASGLTPLSVVRRIEPLGCYFLPAGSQLANPSDLLHGDEFAKIMESLLPHFKWIVIDSPPVVPVADALALARQADASLLVVRAGQTPGDAVEAAMEALGPAHVMGVILNGVEGLDRLYSKYNKYYGPPAPAIGRRRRGAAE
jgi:capsular exopolysaccharide synthesis family protein